LVNQTIIFLNFNSKLFKRSSFEVIPSMSEGTIPTERLIRKTKNQYSNESKKEVYQWIKSNCEELYDEYEVFGCWIPIKDTKGFDYMKEQNQFRISYQGKKILIHVFTKSVFEDNTDNLDVSHLCHDRQCCRPSHLVYEDRSYNKSRDGCAGYVIDEKNALLICKHKPPCKVTSKIRKALKLNKIKE
jgi:Zinc-binding loop region of homing endonuclease